MFEVSCGSPDGAHSTPGTKAGFRQSGPCEPYDQLNPGPSWRGAIPSVGRSNPQELVAHRGPKGAGLSRLSPNWIGQARTELIRPFLPLHRCAVTPIKTLAVRAWRYLAVTPRLSGDLRAKVATREDKAPCAHCGRIGWPSLRPVTAIEPMSCSSTEAALLAFRTPMIGRIKSGPPSGRPPRIPARGEGAHLPGFGVGFMG